VFMYFKSQPPSGPSDSKKKNSIYIASNYYFAKFLVFFTLRAVRQKIRFLIFFKNSIQYSTRRVPEGC
jgi:hypothetical protein